jgi:Restriction Enzyme Adenine Methylase Associated
MPKRNQLVCQHLENVSRDVLEKHQEIVRQYVRGLPGVYALYRRGKIYYVGLASNLRNRLAHHLKDRHHDSWDRFSVYITIGDSHMRELESLILRIIKPPGNKQKGKFMKSEDLKRRFARDWYKEMRLTLSDLLGRPKLLLLPKQIARSHGRSPILSQYANGLKELRARYKGKTLRAYVRQTGLIWFAGKHFTSPSLAGAHAQKRRTCNGWTFWQYQRAPGDWVTLDNLRK